MDIKDTMVALRESRGYTKKEVSDKTGIPYTTYVKYESGERKDVSTDTLLKLADLYNVSTDYILGRAEMTSVEKFGGEFNMSALEKKILDGYVNLPPNLRGDLMAFLQRSVQDVMSMGAKKETPTTDTVTVQYAARSPDSQGAGTRELNAEQIEALNNAPNHLDDLD